MLPQLCAALFMAASLGVIDCTSRISATVEQSDQDCDVGKLLAQPGITLLPTSLLCQCLCLSFYDSALAID